MFISRAHPFNTYVEITIHKTLVLLLLISIVYDFTTVISCNVDY